MNCNHSAMSSYKNMLSGACASQQVVFLHTHTCTLKTRESDYMPHSMELGGNEYPYLKQV